MLLAEAGGRRQRQRDAHQRFCEQGRQKPLLDPKGEEKLSKFGWEFVDRILSHGNDICLLINSSVNAYRRLDPHSRRPTN